jgi:hypothetical protein
LLATEWRLLWTGCLGSLQASPFFISGDFKMTLNFFLAVGPHSLAHIGGPQVGGLHQHYERQLLGDMTCLRTVETTMALSTHRMRSTRNFEFGLTHTRTDSLNPGSYTHSPSWGPLESVSNTKSNPGPTNTEMSFICAELGSEASILRLQNSFVCFLVIGQIPSRGRETSGCQDQWFRIPRESRRKDIWCMNPSLYL